MLVFVSILCIILFNVYVLHKKKKLRSVLKSIYVLDIIDDVNYLLSGRQLHKQVDDVFDATAFDVTAFDVTAFDAYQPSVKQSEIEMFETSSVAKQSNPPPLSKSNPIMDLLSDQSFIETGSAVDVAYRKPNKNPNIESYSTPNTPNMSNQVTVDSHVVYNEPAYAFGDAENQAMYRSQEQYLESLFDSFDGPNISPYE